MGRYLAAGVAVKILITERKDSFYSSEDVMLKSHKKQIINQISKFIDLNHYNTVEGEDYLEFTIDIDYFNNNIYECFNEFNNAVNLSSDSYKLTYDFEERQKENKEVKLQFNRDDFPIVLGYDDEKLKLTIDNELYNYDGLDEQAFASNVWMFYEDTKKLFDKFKIYISYVCLYRDVEKIMIEDDRNLLTALNVFCKKIFKKGLSQNISFYISG